MKKILVAIFLVALTLTCSLITQVKADSIVTLKVSMNQNNATQYPYNTYSLVTLNETLGYNNIQSVTYPNDGLVGVQIQDSSGATMVIRALSTGSVVPYNIPASINQAYLSNGQEQQITSIGIPSESNSVLPIFYVQVTNNLGTTQPMLVTFNVFDSNGVPITEASQLLSSVAAYSSSEALVDFDIPAWTHCGTAYAYVDVFSGWPSQGGVPLSEEKAFQFTITGSPSFQGTPPTTYSLNGPPYKNFNMTFRLPKDPATGTYTAYSTTNYLGTKGSTTTYFSVALLDDLNGDGRVNFNDVSTLVSMYIAYYTSHTFTSAIDYDHNGRINFNDINIFVEYYIQYWSS
jgi:hypothetical protein